MFYQYFLSFLCFFLYLPHLFAVYPPINSNKTGMLQVDEIHHIYWEESGNPEGVPVIFLHGGPGVGTQASYRTFFDPSYYRIILFDQRGCGKSLPKGCLERNTTWDLVEDINKLRVSLGIEKCLLFGGSWGSTLALSYAIKHPENVSGLILRGIFLCRQKELDWFYCKGAHEHSPKAWEILQNFVGEGQKDLLSAYHENLNSECYFNRINAAAAWVLWEFANMQAVPDSRLDLLLNYRLFFYVFAHLYAEQNLMMATIENHYFVNKCFFETDNWILENLDKIQHIPGVIVQGECDRICPWENAAELHHHWPQSRFFLVPNAGHASTEPGILECLLQATEDFKSH